MKPLRQSRALTLALVLAALALVALPGCGGGGSTTSGGGSGGSGGGSSSSGGGSASKIDLSGASFTVGSKEFTEQLILGQMTIQALEAAGAKVSDQTGLEGSVAARKALTSGETDMYWEYTGTAWVTYLKHEKGIPDQQKQFQALKKEDAKSNDVVWVDLAPANNTYAIAAKPDTGTALDQVDTLSQLADLVNSQPDLTTLCVGQEFASRPDGLPGVEKAYGFQFPKDDVSLVGDSVVYTEVAKGDRCVLGSVFATDGRIESEHLRVLEDDKHYFPFYNLALTVRKDVYDKYPQIRQLFAPIAKALTTKTMSMLNAKVDVDGEKPEDVAHDFLVQQGVIGG